MQITIALVRRLHRVRLAVDDGPERSDELCDLTGVVQEVNISS
jgi:hypothetical protein